MMYRVELSEIKIKNFKKIDKQIAKMINAWISKNLDGFENQRIHGKGLFADKKGVWRYRVGDYWLLAHIFDDLIIISVIDVAHRRDFSSKVVNSLSTN